MPCKADVNGLCAHGVTPMECAHKALEAERDRYRAALEKIAHSPHSLGKWAMEIAEKALTGDRE